MQDGRVIEEGAVYDIFASPKEPLTLEFIRSVVSFDIPAAILSEVKGQLEKASSLIRYNSLTFRVISYMEPLNTFRINL